MGYSERWATCRGSCNLQVCHRARCENVLLQPTEQHASLVSCCSHHCKCCLCDAHSLCAGPANATHPDGSHISQAQIAYHHNKGASAVLAVAFDQTLHVAVLPEDLAKAAVLDCVSERDLPLSSMVAIEISHQIRCLAFSPSGNKLAAATSAERVISHCKDICIAPTYLISCSASARFCWHVATGTNQSRNLHASLNR